MSSTLEILYGDEMVEDHDVDGEILKLKKESLREYMKFCNAINLIKMCSSLGIICDSTEDEDIRDLIEESFVAEWTQQLKLSAETRTQRSAAIETPEMIFIALCDFFETRCRLAIKKGKVFN